MTNMETFYDYTLSTKPSNRCDEYLQKTHLCYSVNEKSSEMLAVISCSTLRHFKDTCKENSTLINYRAN